MIGPHNPRLSVAGSHCGYARGWGKGSARRFGAGGEDAGDVDRHRRWHVVAVQGYRVVEVINAVGGVGAVGPPLAVDGHQPQVRLGVGEIRQIGAEVVQRLDSQLVRGRCARIGLRLPGERRGQWSGGLRQHLGDPASVGADGDRHRWPGQALHPECLIVHRDSDDEPVWLGEFHHQQFVEKSSAGVDHVDHPFENSRSAQETRRLLRSPLVPP